MKIVIFNESAKSGHLSRFGNQFCRNGDISADDATNDRGIVIVFYMGGKKKWRKNLYLKKEVLS